VTDVLARVDLYFDTRHATTDELSLCGNPSAKGVLWYGSYFTQRCSAGSDDCCCEDPAHPEEGNDGYFLDFPSLAHTQDKSGWDKSKRQMAFTLTFRTSNSDNLPHKGDRHLRKFLNQASEVVRTIKYKAGVYW
jgi:hypothetical protein